MAERNFRTVFFFLALLAGCTLQQPCNTEDAKAAIVGMSTDEMSTCMGKPAKKTTKTNAEIWSYTYGTCTVNLDVAGDRVEAADYSVPPDSLPPKGTQTEQEQCASVPVVASCLRWLRSPTIFDKSNSTIFDDK